MTVSSAGRFILLLILCTFILPEIVSAQRVNRGAVRRRHATLHPNVRVWGSYGEGIFMHTRGDDDGFGGIVSSGGLTVAVKDFCIKPRFTRFIEHAMFSDFEPFESFNEFGLLLGGKIHDGIMVFRVMGGLGFIWGEMRDVTVLTSRYLDPYTGIMEDGTYTVAEIVDFKGPSIPVECDFYVKPNNVFGIGLSFIATLNAKRPVAGLMLGLNLGRVDKWTAAGR